ncbi:hypothetical protein MWH28_12260 [Natroniella sulfidigena]|uniref:hypothetical protein n=1 Tax=Natroniella sulfidigena TaxID=723921 RepID=UPI00200B6D1F|nr:hypothetical protein [Natroniella sulfidigena]MCK8818130.1 hypothetical protein [Natroniella sulfidigena]
MKKSIAVMLLSLIVLTTLTTGLAQANRSRAYNPNLRATKWGMNRAEVKAAERHYTQAIKLYSANEISEQNPFYRIFSGVIDLAFSVVGTSVSDLAKANNSDSNLLVRDRPNELVYKLEVMGIYPTYLNYNFQNDKVNQATYSFEPDYNLNDPDQLNNYIKHYYQLQKLLGDKYSQPKTNDVNWTRKYYRNTLNDRGRGTAVKWGFLNYQTVWVTDDTTIELKLYQDRFQPILELNYYSNHYETGVDMSKF